MVGRGGAGLTSLILPDMGIFVALFAWVDNVLTIEKGALNIQNCSDN